MRCGALRSSPHEARSWATRTTSWTASPSCVHLGQHDVFGARPLQAPERRDGAEAAAPVAPLGHLHIGPRRVGRGTREVQEVEGGEGLAVRALVGEGACGPPAQGHRHPEARHQVDLGQGRRQLVAVALGQASRHHQARPLVAGGGELENGVDRFLAGRLDEGAGVHHHELGVVGRRRGLVARRAAASRPACPSRPGSSDTPGSPTSIARPPGQSTGHIKERRGRDLNPRTQFPRSTH